MPGNARAGQPDGKRHRKQTASGLAGGKGETVGQEPTALLATGAAWQAPPGAMPNRTPAPRHLRAIRLGPLQPRGVGLAA